MVIVIMGILAAVAVPKVFSIAETFLCQTTTIIQAYFIRF
ncbi:MAG: hypothetical protein MJZ05_13315 [Fibrobacter sp.]|nr:hypothetical protein [Fibrobacter sp.]